MERTEIIRSSEDEFGLKFQERSPLRVYAPLRGKSASFFSEEKRVPSLARAESRRGLRGEGEGEVAKTFDNRAIPTSSCLSRFASFARYGGASRLVLASLANFAPSRADFNIARIGSIEFAEYRECSNIAEKVREASPLILLRRHYGIRLRFSNFLTVQNGATQPAQRSVLPPRDGFIISRISLVGDHAGSIRIRVYTYELMRMHVYERKIGTAAFRFVFAVNVVALTCRLTCASRRVASRGKGGVVGEDHTEWWG